MQLNINLLLGTEDSVDYARAPGGEAVSFEDGFGVPEIGDPLGFPFLEATGGGPDELLPEDRPR